MLLFVLLFCAVLTLTRFLALSARDSPAEQFRYRSKRPLTEAEAHFFTALASAVPPHLHIWAKVRLADIVEPEVRPDRWRSAFNRISQKHIDFVLVDPVTVQCVLAIELDDRSHALPKRSRRDAVVDQVLATAQIPLLREKCKMSYSARKLESSIRELCHPCTRAA